MLLNKKKLKLQILKMMMMKWKLSRKWKVPSTAEFQLHEEKYHWRPVQFAGKGFALKRFKLTQLPVRDDSSEKSPSKL